MLFRSAHAQRAASHIGVPARPRTRSTTSLLSGTSIMSSRSSAHLSPDKAKYGDSRQGPKFYDANCNPFSLNRVSRVKSPVPDRRMNVTPHAKSMTGTVGPYRRDAPHAKHTRTHSTGHFQGGHFKNLSSKSSTSSSDYFSTRTESTLQDLP